MGERAARAWLTATPPTPNGGLHIGHLAGPYIAADVLRRRLEGDGIQTLLTTGIDDHQTYVPVAAQRQGRDPGELADAYGDQIESDWRAAEVEFEVSVRPRRDPDHIAETQAFFAALHERGHLVSRRLPVPWCERCERWLCEAYVSGRCPHCKASSGGNACEDCGQPNHCGDLLDPWCVTCGDAAALRECARLFFPLAAHGEALAAFWEEVAMPPHLRLLCEQMREGGLPEIAVTQPVDWGIPVPVPGFEDQRIYVWLEMAPGYLIEARRAAEQRGLLEPDEVTHADDGAFVQFFGFDNGYFHAVLFPALFRAFDPGIRLPDAFVVNEFYQLEGRKFSTSGQHLVWAHELLATESVDLVRWHLLADRPQSAQTSFAMEGFGRTREHLHDRWDAWLRTLTEELRQHCDARVPQEPPAGPEWQTLRARLGSTLEQLRSAYDATAFDLRRATHLIDGLAAMGQEFGLAHAHVAHSPGLRGHHRAGLAAQVVVAQALAAWAEPIVPSTARRVARAVGYEGSLAVTDDALAPPEPGRPVTPLAARLFGDAHG